LKFENEFGHKIECSVEEYFKLLEFYKTIKQKEAQEIKYQRRDWSKLIDRFILKIKENAGQVALYRIFSDMPRGGKFYTELLEKAKQYVVCEKRGMPNIYRLTDLGETRYKQLTGQLTSPAMDSERELYYQRLRQS